MKKQSFSPYFFVILLLLLSCEKEDPVSSPQLRTFEATQITSTDAISGGEISSTGGGTITSKGVVWSTSSNPTTNDFKTNDGSGPAPFNSNLSQLTPGTSYYVRAFAENEAGISYGNQIEFSTDATLPTVNTLDPTLIESTSATLRGEVINAGGSSISSRGFVWSTDELPDMEDNVINNGQGEGEFISEIVNLLPGQTIYVRAFAENSKGVGYGNQIMFRTKATLATIETVSLSKLLPISVNAIGKIISDGGGTLERRGVVLNTSSEPTVEDQVFDFSQDQNEFQILVDELLPETTYYLRAFVINEVGISYGNSLQFTTPRYASGDGVSDIDGNFYESAHIGTQEWMTSNLKTTKYCDGDEIPQVSNSSQWINLNNGAYSYFDNSSSNKEPYGLLYNWFAAVDSRNICPCGWRVPTDEDWEILELYLGMPQSELKEDGPRGEAQNVGGKLKQKGELYWNNNQKATNETGFNGRGGGRRRDTDGEFINQKIYGYWWSTRNVSDSLGYGRLLYGTDGFSWATTAPKNSGLSVRCIKEN